MDVKHQVLRINRFVRFVWIVWIVRKISPPFGHVFWSGVNARFSGLGHHKVGGTCLQVPATGNGHDCDPVLPKSKGCAILTKILYPFEIKDFFIFQKFKAANRWMIFATLPCWSSLPPFLTVRIYIYLWRILFHTLVYEKRLNRINVAMNQWLV